MINSPGNSVFLVKGESAISTEFVSISSLVVLFSASVIVRVVAFVVDGCRVVTFSVNRNHRK